MENVPSCLSSFIDTGSRESHRYYLARRTTLEMLRDRGYDVPTSEIDLSLQEFRSVFSQQPNLEQLRISVPLLSDPTKKVMVIFCGNEVVKKPTATRILQQITNSADLHKLILILENKITAQAKQHLKLCRVKVEDFQITDLLVNITKHVLMPKHEILSSVEKDKLLKKFSVGENQIPRMLETDAVARYYGLEKGQVVKVTTDSDVTGPLVTYRCVM
ncbi:DNA-directed RNA polymerases I, II, and III subunit RPABC1 [Thalictrum thalictroides]|uniref:DNA-directed RNA polymerases I, II, and III subunit RPABC1 n=1 Tax=Thalictrum thalictroides TaxID=46969 RepID=A0A7J6X3P0_THATH|nr:DNA-directed RNA polymerases I, II, and III subunit RPABC1 [Thalictrum thalictroides]